MQDRHWELHAYAQESRHLLALPTQVNVVRVIPQGDQMEDNRAVWLEGITSQKESCWWIRIKQRCHLPLVGVNIPVEDCINHEASGESFEWLVLGLGGRTSSHG